MAVTSDKSDMLFACTNCHRRCKFEELSANQQLCKVRHLLNVTLVVSDFIYQFKLVQCVIWVTFIFIGLYNYTKYYPTI